MLQTGYRSSPRMLEGPEGSRECIKSNVRKQSAKRREAFAMQLKWKQMRSDNWTIFIKLQGYRLLQVTGNKGQHL